MIILKEEEYRKWKLEGKLEQYSDYKIISIQDYLQFHFLSSIHALVSHIKQQKPELLDKVIVGYDTLNEPSGGFLGCNSLQCLSAHQELRNGLTPTPLQSFLLGEGRTQKVDKWSFTAIGPKKTADVIVNTEQERCWLPDYGCIWAAHGLYDLQSEKVLKDEYFARVPGTGEPVDWVFQYWKPFVRRFHQMIKTVHSSAILFIEPPVNEPPPLWEPAFLTPTQTTNQNPEWWLPDAETTDPPLNEVCYAPHWYDGLTLMNKHFSTWWTIDYLGYKRGKYSNILSALSFGLGGIKRNFGRQLALLKNEGLAFIGQAPCLLGEIGIPFDMDDKQAYKTGNYGSQLKALDANLCALEENLLNFTLWNYCPDNSNQWGDQWNGEDLSLYSPNGNHQRQSTSVSGKEVKKNHLRSRTAPSTSCLNQQHLNEGGRALAAFLRPYPLRTCGYPLQLSFDYESKKKTFYFQFQSSAQLGFKHNSVLGQGTEIYLPIFHFGLPLDSILSVESASGYFPMPAIEDEQQLLFGYNLDELKQFDYFQVQATPGSKWTFDPHTQILHFFHSEQKMNDKNFYEIKIEVVSNQKNINKLLNQFQQLKKVQDSVLLMKEDTNDSSFEQLKEKTKPSFCPIL